MKIKVIFTGGTIGSRVKDSSVELMVEPPYALLRGVEGNCVEFETAEPYSILSEELSAEHLVKLARCIEQESQGFDGVIVTHGTDSICYTAAFLSYLFGDSLPIALVSSGAPLSSCHSNGRHNLAAAVEYIKSGNKGVAVPWYFHGAAVIHHGARLFRQRPYDDLLQSIGDEVLFYAGNVLTGSWRENSGSGRLASLLSCDDAAIAGGFGKVMNLKSLPGMYYPELSQDISAVLIESYHSGTLCADACFEKFMAQAKQLGIPVFITGTGGRAQEYVTAEKSRAAGAIPLPQATPDSMYVKLCLAISAGGDIKEIMTENCAGEIIPEANFKAAGHAAVTQ